MELTLEQSRYFLQYLIELGVITPNEETNIIEKISNQSKRCLFLFADFLKCLTPSDCYDVALRMMQVWSQKQQKQYEKLNIHEYQTKKNIKIPSTITEEENEDTQIELPNELPFQNQKNVSEIMKKQQQIQQQAIKEQKKDQLQSADVNDTSNNSLSNMFYQNYCKPSFQNQSKQEVEVQRKKRMDRTFVNEQLEKLSKLLNKKIKINLKYCYQLLKNHSLKQKINSHNIQVDTKQKQLNFLSNNIRNQTSKILLNYQESSISDHSNKSQSQNQKQQNKSLNDINSQSNIQQGERDTTSLKKFDKILKPYQIQIQQISQNKAGNQEQTFKTEQVSGSNNTSISYNNNNNNNSSQSQGFSLQQSLKSEENKACTFRPLSTLISPTNNTAIKFNFSALNSANATPELYNRQNYYQYREQIMGYSPSSQSEENTQVKNNNSQMFSCQKTQEDNLFLQNTLMKNEKNNQKFNYHQNQYFSKQDEEIQKEFCQDLGLQNFQGNNGFQQESSQEIDENSLGMEKNDNDIQQLQNQQQQYNINNIQQKYLNEIQNKTDKQVQNIQQSYPFTSNAQYNNNQVTHFSNFHNYSHISKNLDDSTSINFESSLRSLTKPLNAQRQQSQNMFTNSQMNSFFMQSQDTFTGQQNLSQFGEQLAITQMNPFVSEIQFSNNKNQFDSFNDPLSNRNSNNEQQKFQDITDDSQNQNNQEQQNCQFENELNMRMKFYNQQNQIQQINDFNHNKNASSNITQKNQNNQDQDKQIEHIYIQQEDSQLLTDEESSNQNSVTLHQNNDNNYQNYKNSVDQNQELETNEVNNDQVKQERSHQNNFFTDISIQKSSFKQIGQQLPIFQQNDTTKEKETSNFDLIYQASKITQYCFDEENYEEQNNQIDIQENNDLKNDIQQNLNQKILQNKMPIQDEANRYVQTSLQKQNIQANIDQPEQAQLLSIQPCQLQQKQSPQNSKDETIKNKENSQTNSQQVQNVISKSKSALILNELYIDFDNEQLRQQNKYSLKSPNFSQTSKQSTNNLGDSVHEKLYNLRKTKEQEQKAYENIKLQQELKNCTFTPQLISKNKSSPSYSISQKNQKLNMQSSKENIFKSENVNFTFENFENSSSSEIQKLSKKQDEESERTKIRETLEKETKERQLLGSSQKQHAYTRTSKGSLYQNSEKDSQSSKDQQKSLSVFEKLYQDNQIKLINQSINQRVQIQNELQKCTFKPSICEQSIRLSRNKSPQSILQEQLNGSSKKDKSKDQERKGQENISALNNILNRKQNMGSLRNIKQNFNMSNSQITLNNNQSVSNVKKENQLKNNSQEITFEYNILQSNKASQKKSSSLKPILKGCIDFNTDYSHSTNDYQGQKLINNYFVPFNQTLPNTPKLNSNSSTFDQIILKKFKVDKLSDYNSVQIPSLHQQITSESTSSTLRGAQSVRLQKSISFCEKTKKEQLKNQKISDELKSYQQGSPLIQNCKYFQDDIIDENEMSNQKDNNQPQEFNML